MPVFRVFIGSGEFLVCPEVCRQVSLTLQNVVLNEDLFVLGMGGANVVLRIQWLEKLGLVTTNHKDLTIEFDVGDRKIWLQRGPQLTDGEISTSGLRRMMAWQEVAYFCHL